MSNIDRPLKTSHAYTDGAVNNLKRSVEKLNAVAKINSADGTWVLIINERKCITMLTPCLA